MKTIIKSSALRLPASSSILVLFAYVITWRFAALYSFMLLLPGIFISLYFFIVTLYTIIWAFKNSAKYANAYVVAILNPLILFIIYLLPSYSTNKNYPLVTAALCKQVKNNCSCDLYLKYYKVIGGGYMTTDVGSVYLTDLKNFSRYIGTYDQEYENIDITCSGKQITTTKTSHQNVDTYWGPPQLIERKTFTIERLIEEGKFD